MSSSISGTSGSSLAGNSTAVGNFSVGGNLTVTGAVSSIGNGLFLGAGTATVAPLGFVAGTNLTTATVGAMEYDGKVFYATPQSTQRGVVPGAQFFRLNSNLVGADVNTAQNLFGVGVTLSSSTVYAFEAVTAILKTSGTTTHTVGYGFGGTATINNIMWQWHGYDGTTAISQNTSQNSGYATSAANTVINARANTATTIHMWTIVRGTVSVNAGGTLIPQYTLSAAPGGAYSTVAGSYFMIYPIGASGANTSVGTWT